MEQEYKNISNVLKKLSSSNEIWDYCEELLLHERRDEAIFLLSNSIAQQPFIESVSKNNSKMHSMQSTKGIAGNTRVSQKVKAKEKSEIIRNPKCLAWDFLPIAKKGKQIDSQKAYPAEHAFFEASHLTDHQLIYCIISFFSDVKKDHDDTLIGDIIRRYEINTGKKLKGYTQQELWYKLMPETKRYVVVNLENLVQDEVEYDSIGELSDTYCHDGSFIITNELEASFWEKYSPLFTRSSKKKGKKKSQWEEVSFLEEMKFIIACHPLTSFLGKSPKLNPSNKVMTKASKGWNGKIIQESVGVVSEPELRRLHRWWANWH